MPWITQPDSDWPSWTTEQAYQRQNMAFKPPEQWTVTFANPEKPMTYTAPQAPMQSPHQAAVMHPTAQQPMPQQPAPQYPLGPQPPVTGDTIADFQGNFALFQNTLNPQAKHDYTGRLSINIADLGRVFQVLQSQAPDPRGQVSLHLIGFNNTSKAGLRYIGGYVCPEKPPQGQQPTVAQAPAMGFPTPQPLGPAQWTVPAQAQQYQVAAPPQSQAVPAQQPQAVAPPF